MIQTGIEPNTGIGVQWMGGSTSRSTAGTSLKTSSGNQIRRASLAPGAMGESGQVNNDKSAEGQAENRRVVVRVLQNKAIAGI